MWTNIMRNSDPLLKLKANDFRRSFSLGELELLQLEKYGWPLIRAHAEKIVRERLNKQPEHDGRQTPYHGHPVFVAQHATATCCRRCLFKWHRIPLFRDLTQEEVRYCTALILRWISAQEDKARSQVATLTPHLEPLEPVAIH
jgi:hypothetical protein